MNFMYEDKPKLSVAKKDICVGYETILAEILASSSSQEIAIECFPGIDTKKLIESVKTIASDCRVIDTESYYQSKEEIYQVVDNILTDDPVFGRFSNCSFEDFYHSQEIEKSGKKDQPIIWIGIGAADLSKADTVIYANISRWTIQLALKAGATNWKCENSFEDFSQKLKRAFYFEWPAGEEIKRKVLPNSNYMIDLNDTESPKMIRTKDYLEILSEFIKQPFRLVPYFDPGVWGGTWMQEVFGIDQEKINLAWCFDGVPEENSVRFVTNGVEFEVPANDLVSFYPKQLLGEKVFGRYGRDFPIRFDFLDTMGGGNLSLQVHPTLDYAYREFGLKYTQDESYYIIDCKEDAYVYLGLKEGICLPDLIEVLNQAQNTGTFEVEKYVNKIPIRKHDHFLIPAGTIHCSGKDCVVLEISSTPNRFTFKLWDWGRVDLDGKPRPIHISRGEKVINQEMTTKKVNSELVNTFSTLSESSHQLVERTGLHPLEAIETHRLTFDREIKQSTQESVNVLNLVEGDGLYIVCEGIEPMKISYGETVIIPEIVKEYSLQPINETQNCIVMKAFIK